MESDGACDPIDRGHGEPGAGVADSTADARGIHGAGRGMRGAEFAGGHRHGNDAYIKAASEDRDRLLNTRLKSICRGC